MFSQWGGQWMMSVINKLRQPHSVDHTSSVMMVAVCWQHNTDNGQTNRHRQPMHIWSLMQTSNNTWSSLNWSLLNRFRTEQGHYGACRRKWRLTDPDDVPHCQILSPWQNRMAAYLGYTLRMKTLFRGWPVMVHDMHMKRRRLNFNNKIS